MVSSGKFSLNWSEFSDNLTSFFGEQRENADFTDVTLACDDQSPITAHRVLLAASSSFFKEILSKQKNPNLLIYMRGIKSRDLNGLLDFVYDGEVNIYQEDLEGFLALADDLGFKGLERSAMKETLEPKEYKYLVHKSEIFKPKKEMVSTDVLFNNMETTPTIFDKSSSLVGANVFVNDKELEEQIMSMIERREGIWTCKMCGKTGKKLNKKQNIKQHVEGVHMDGGECNQCGKILRSSSALRNHMVAHTN